jgi:hypothetical protein
VLTARAARSKSRRRRFAALARRLTPRSVKVVFHDEGNFGHATGSKREIYVPRPTSADRLQTYFHELGHILDWQRRGHEWSPSESESEYQAEVYAFRMMKIHGIPWSPWEKKVGVAYVGWHVVDDLLHDWEVSAEARAFVGLKGLDDVTIIIAHIIAVQRIGYSPKREQAKKSKWQCRLTDHDWVAPADPKYWSALLASVPTARRKRHQRDFALIRIDRSKPRGPENIAWSRWPESEPRVWVRPMLTEAEIKELMAEIKQQEAVRRPIIEAMKQAIADCDEWDPKIKDMKQTLIDDGEWDDEDGCD